MAVEMVGRQIQEHAYIWTKRVDELELKAAELGHCASVVLHLVHASDERRSDVSCENRRHPGRLQNMFGEQGRRRLAVRTGDPNQSASLKPVGQLNFAPNRDAFHAGRLQMRFVGWHAWARNNQVLFEKCLLPMTTELQGHSRLF